ncbi:MAG: 50S ribosome-binding GTPase [Sedimentisphaerales bacterium]|nr:50S ribosome-binding GTPase [Sedimentisphaerales bacterium]
MFDDNTLSFVIVGHIDHGKSTLIGRLLYDTQSLPPDRIAEMRKASKERGHEAEFAYLLDHLEEERQQGITVDTTQVFFKTDKRHYVIIDTPGHVEFVKNMITGASQAEAAVLIVDVAEGVKEQTQRHSFMLSMLGLDQVIVVFNKMDIVEYSQEKFEQVKTDALAFLKSINIEPNLCIPISAMKGDNVATKSEKMNWYDGPCFLASLDSLKNKQPAENMPLLLPVQDIYKIDDKRINVGRVESGVIRRGDEVEILPTHQKTKIKSIERFLEERDIAVSSECIGFTTEDAVFLDRGAVICGKGANPELTDSVSASIIWMSKKPLSVDEKLDIRCATQEVSCKVKEIKERINSSTLEILEENASQLNNLEVAEVTIKTKKPIAVKDFNDVQELGRFVLVRDQNICAGGIVTS